MIIIQTNTLSFFNTSGTDKQQCYDKRMDFASVFAEVNDRRPIDFNSILLYAFKKIIFMYKPLFSLQEKS